MSTLMRAVILGGTLLGIASCSGESQVPLTPTPPERMLTLTLTQGENSSGPYAGTVTGPNGFTCTLKQSDRNQACPSAQFSDGQTITLNTTLVAGVPGDRPIWRAVGCDSVTSSACTLAMTADRSVTISIGCAICSDGPQAGGGTH